MFGVRILFWDILLENRNESSSGVNIRGYSYSVPAHTVPKGVDDPMIISVVILQGLL